MTTDKKTYRAEELVSLIRAKYPTSKNGYNVNVVLEQVPNGTSRFQDRWIDVAVFKMWQSTGLTRSAFEIKVSRSDFLNELKQPEKHKWCLDCFHEFWFVAPKEIIQIEELPEGVGWFYPKGSKLVTARQAKYNSSPKLDDILLAAFMRAAYKEIELAGKRTEDEILKNNSEFQKAKLYRDAFDRYFESQNIYKIPLSVEEILQLLIDSKMDKQLKEDVQRLNEVSGRFQEDIGKLSGLFFIIANKCLLARDELGKAIVERWGGVDNYSLISLKETAKKYKTNYTRDVDIIETILAWNKLREKP